ncbi:MAG: bile acid:Na+ symporter, BASS family [Methyloprofundus sp.]|nr:MAG: bile acid:Na+ symporter, BASS family [Methyloprofundus sp.]
MNEILKIVLGISMLGFVAGSMITLGLGLTVAKIIAPFKNFRMIFVALIANFVLVPLFAYGIVDWLDASEGVRIGIILLSLGGGAPFIPVLVETARGNVGGSVGLMVLLLMVTVFFLPLVAPLLLPGTLVNSWDIAKSLVSIMLVPLVFALIVKALFANFAACMQPYMQKLTSISILMLIVAVLMLYTETVIASVSILPIIVMFFLGAMLIGFFTGGKSRNARITLAVGTGLRNPPVAILVASQNFSTEPMAAIVPLLVAIVGVLILFPLAILIRKKVA